MTDWDDLITRQIKTARQYVEDYIGGCLITQTIQEYFDEFPCNYLELARFPIISIISVTYTDSDGDTQTWAATNYNTDKVSKMGRIAPKPSKTWPTNDDSLNSIEIEYTAGYGAADDVPEVYKDAMLLTVGHLFENREDRVHTLPTRVLDLLHRRANWQF